MKKTAGFFDSHFKALDENKSLRFSVFIVPALALALLCGTAVPSTIIESESANYCFVDGYTSPFVFIFVPAMQALGLFVFWPFVFYALFSERVKKILSVLFTLVLVCSLINCFIFGGNYGPMNPDLEFMQANNFRPSAAEFALNSACLAAAIFLFYFLLEKKQNIARIAVCVLAVSMAALSGINFVSIKSAFSKMPAPAHSENLDPVFHLSKNGKNVVVFMLDACVSPYIPYVFETCRNLDRDFDGFKWYPNTVSLGRMTMLGLPGLLGGYDYTPFRFNMNEEKTVQEKYNEALLSLPLLFSENGWSVQVAGLSYENFLEQPEYNMYVNNPDLNNAGIELESSSDTSKNPYYVKYRGHKTIQHNSLTGVYSDYWYAQNGIQRPPYLSSKIFRNFLWFSIFKIVPPVLRMGVYHEEYWFHYNKYKSSGPFVDSYSALDYLPELTDFYDDTVNEEKVNGTFLIFDTEVTHGAISLEAPEYTYAENVTDYGEGPYNTRPDFSVVCGALKRISEYLDRLKKNGAYDNTRIIIVSDHGKAIGVSELLQGTRLPFDKNRSLALLMVKDFNEHGKFISAPLTQENMESGIFGKEIDMTFMTNADTPHLASKELIPDAKNPFTGNLLKVENKNDYSILSIAPSESTRIKNNRKFTVGDSEWYTVKDNIFADENWQPLYPQGEK